MARIVIYRRASQDREGREVTVDRQERMVRDKLIRPDDVVVGVFTDNDVSASRYGRKVRKDYAAMLKLGAAGGYDEIASYSFKRVTRRYDEGGALLDLAETASIGFRFVRGAPVDLNSAAGRKAFRAMINDAIGESEEISERVIDKFTEKRASGEHHGGGVRRFGFSSSSGQLVHEPVEAAAIRQAAADVLRGVSLRSIAARWNASGLRPPKAERWVGATVRQVLVRPSTAGLIAPAPGRGDRKPVPGNWDAIIDEPTRQRLLALFADPGRRSTMAVSDRWIGSGLYRCGRCDDGSLLGSHNVNKLPGYVCTHGLDPVTGRRNRTHLGVQAEPVDEFVRTAVAELLDTRGPDLLAVDRSAELAAFSHELETTRTRQADLGRAYAKGEVSWLAFSAADAGMTRRVNELLTDLASITPGDGPLTGVADAPAPGEAFRGLPVERQRAVVRALADVTIMPADPSKRRMFDYGRIMIEWTYAGKPST